MMSHPWATAKGWKLGLTVKVSTKSMGDVSPPEADPPLAEARIQLCRCGRINSVALTTLWVHWIQRNYFIQSYDPIERKTEMPWLFLSRPSSRGLVSFPPCCDSHDDFFLWDENTSLTEQ
jgi:hypothetical protein